MGKKFQLTIPTPCHENWEAMTPVDKGRFCAACQKQVMDFSNMNDRQVAEFFKKPSTGSVCGRFMPNQLQRDMELPVKRIPWVKYFFQFAIPAFFVSAKAKAQGEVRVISSKPAVHNEQQVMVGKVVPEVCSLPVPRNTPASAVSVKNNQLTIKGFVTDEYNNPMRYVSVMIKGTKYGTLTDSTGLFRLAVPAGEKKITLQVSCIGFETMEKEISTGELTNEAIIRLPALISIIAGEVVVVKTKSKKKKAISKPVPLMEDRAVAVKETVIKLFPNPVAAGGNLNIEWKQQDEGYYNLEILSLAGQTIKQQTIWIDKDARLLSIDVPTANPGTYIIRISNKKTGKAGSEKVIIQ
ncbi:MAG: carboxypeptidase-like regulatory domain-containing protein [Chitinophagales bacterium]|nr:carboxypeptidase-like regulatory domain-containing protein [Chitinophagales bacterium]